MCVTENHVPCFRDYRQLSAMRRLVRGFRVAVGFVWLVMLTLWLVLLVDGQPLSVLGIWVGAWVAAVAVLWTKLAWPVELERRRVQLERDADVPWDVIR